MKEWRRALSAQKAFFVLLDGFALDAGSEYFRPRFQDVKPQSGAVDAVEVAGGRRSQDRVSVDSAGIARNR